MATDVHATTTIDIRISTSRTLHHALVEYEERVAADDRRRCVEADLQPPLDLADFADLMYRNKLEAARRLAQLADQPGGERLLYRQASAWAAYINETHLFQGDEVWFPADVLSNFACAIRVYQASRVECDERAASDERAA
jgi:hypothetical protein